MSALDVMVDLETLDTRASAVVLSLGAVAFDPITGDEGTKLHLFLELDDQLRQGRTVSGATLLWWLGQSETAIKAQLDRKRMPLVNALIVFEAWLANITPSRFWANGSDFDIAILNHAWDQAQRRKPWKYNTARDLRTIKDLLTEADIPPRDGTLHDALDDARFQAKIVVAVERKIAGWRAHQAAEQARATP